MPPVASATQVDSPSARAELVRALGAFAEAPGARHRDLADALGFSRPVTRAEHTEAFVLECHPYASFHLSGDGGIGGEVTAQVAGFWKVLGLDPPPEPDHLVALLGLYAALLDAEGDGYGYGYGAGYGGPVAEPDRDADPGSGSRSDAPPGRGDLSGKATAIAARSRAALLWEHLVPWVPGLLDSVATAAPAYREWGELLGEVLLREVAWSPEPTRLPAALRQAAPGLGRGHASPGHGGTSDRGDDPVALLVAPVRCGMVLTPAVLAGGADDLGLALRVGGRRFLLESLLAQEPATVLRWLAEEAERWAVRHEARAGAFGRVAVFWSGRAAAASAWLTEASELPSRWSTASS